LHTCRYNYRIVKLITLQASKGKATELITTYVLLNIRHIEHLMSILKLSMFRAVQMHYKQIQ
jgi:hypothetical protein